LTKRKPPHTTLSQANSTAGFKISISSITQRKSKNLAIVTLSEISLNSSLASLEVDNFSVENDDNDEVNLSILVNFRD
jgi:hypothetical protein